MSETTSGQCPVFDAGRAHPTYANTNTEWWPNKLNLKVLAKNTPVSNPLAADFNYAEAFEALDLDAVKADLAEAMTKSYA